MELTGTNIVIIITILGAIGATFKWFVPLAFKAHRNQIESNTEGIEKNSDDIDKIEKDIIRLDEAEKKNADALKDHTDRIGRMDDRVREANERSSDNKSAQQKMDTEISQLKREKSKLFELSDANREDNNEIKVAIARSERRND